MRLVWLPRAISTRDAQIDYIAQRSPRTAIIQGDRIEDQLNDLLMHPEMGRPGRKEGTRELVISRTPFVVVYRIRPRAKRIELLCVLHGAQMWPPAR